MRPNDVVRLRHLEEAATKAVTFCEGRTRSDLENDEMLRLAVTKLVEIVGEAAKHVSEDTRRVPGISLESRVSDARSPRSSLLRHQSGHPLDDYYGQPSTTLGRITIYTAGWGRPRIALPQGDGCVVQ